MIPRVFKVAQQDAIDSLFGVESLCVLPKECPTLYRDKKLAQSLRNTLEFRYQIRWIGKIDLTFGRRRGAGIDLHLVFSDHDKHRRTAVVPEFLVQAVDFCSRDRVQPFEVDER